MIYIILGTKGQFMKMFPIMKLFDKNKVLYKFIHTGQHYGIIEDNIKRFKVKKPDVYLTIKKDDLKNIWEMVEWVPKVLWNARALPITKDDCVIIHGDAESTLLGFLIGKFFRAKIAHVESGYRSGDALEPFPEEIIRRFVDRFSDIDFTPYEKFVFHINKKNGIIVTNGNTVFDSVRYALAESVSLKAKKLMNKKYAILLIHRKENLFVKNRMEIIIDSLDIILKNGLRVIWPIHTNTKFELEKKDLWRKVDKLKSKYDLVLDYFFDYVDFMHLIENSEFVASDGGGVQKETYFMDIPMLILRKKTEYEPGVGENSFLSYLKMEKILYFLKNYKEFRRKGEVKGSPSKIVVDYFLGLSRG